MAAKLSSPLFSGCTAKEIFTKAFIAVYKDRDVHMKDISQWIKLSLYFEDPSKTLRRGSLFHTWLPKYPELFQTGACVFGFGIHSRPMAALCKYWSHEYLVDVIIGRQTADCYSHSPLIKYNDCSHVSNELIQTEMKKFIGEIEQYGPGTLFYQPEQKQKQETVDSDSDDDEQTFFTSRINPIRKFDDDPPPRVKQCYSIEILNRDDRYIRFLIKSDPIFNCRSFIRDLGQAIQCPSSIDSLHLKKCGPVSDEQCLQKHELHYEQIVQCAQNITPSCVEYLKELREMYPLASAGWRFI